MLSCGGLAVIADPGAEGGGSGGPKGGISAEASLFRNTNTSGSRQTSSWFFIIFHAVLSETFGSKESKEPHKQDAEAHTGFS